MQRRQLVLAAVATVVLLGACGARTAMSGGDGAIDHREARDRGVAAVDAGVPPRADAPRPSCPGDPQAPICDVYMDVTRCPAGARRTVIGCRPRCQDLLTCAEVPALPAALCSTNGECLPHELCQADGLCVVTGAIAGTCVPRPAPASCPVYDTCPFVCGCDGQTYCDSCQAHAAGVSVATIGACLASTCAGLEVAYETELGKARQCCADCESSLQCVTTVPAKLACGCDTMVNKRTPGMDAVRDEWMARGCMFGITCPALQCVPAKPGSCQPTSAPAGPTPGVCVD